MSASKRKFKAEVQQLLDLMIHSVYSNRDVFLRELVSNASDALDKVRFTELTEGGLVPAGHDEPGIHVTIDADAGLIILEDDGVGMTKDEAVENLGTIAHSGTKAFFEQAKDKGGDLPDLIGQFGVGFYSCFMVAERVVVESRSATPGSEGVKWVSEGAGTYSVSDSDKATRGTTITLYLREDAKEYADEDKLRQIVREHSNYLPWPILLGESKLNTGKAIWTEKPSEVEDEEANEFYKSLTFDWEAPLMRVHFQVDSPLQYSAMLFVPRNRPYDLFVPEADRGPRLYARRVLIADHAKDLLPDWLRFVRGVVDSQDIPLNMSREMVQKTPVMRAIRDAVVKRVLKELGRLAKQDAPEEGEHPYTTFWKSFGILIKEGYVHDASSYGERIQPLLRFNLLSHDDASGLASLDDYKAAMPEGQDAIWYFSAPTREAALASPHLEAFQSKGWDVILLTDPVDEWLVQALTEVDGLEVKSVSRGELDLDEEDDTVDKADLAGLAPWMTELFGGTIASVRPSTRLTNSPAVLVDDEAGPSANMERILRAANQEVPTAKRHLELNVKHPFIANLAALHDAGASDVAEPLARLLLDEAMLIDGSVKDPASVGKRLQALLEQAASQALAARA